MSSVKSRQVKSSQVKCQVECQVECQVKSSQVSSQVKSSVKSSQVKCQVESSQVKSSQVPSQVSSQVSSQVKSSQVKSLRLTGLEQPTREAQGTGYRVQSTSEAGRGAVGTKVVHVRMHVRIERREGRQWVLR